MSSFIEQELHKGWTWTIILALADRSCVPSQRSKQEFTCGSSVIQTTPLEETPSKSWIYALFYSGLQNARAGRH